MKKLFLSILFLISCSTAWATVPSATPLFSQYSCNSSTTQFPYTFQISAASDIQVYVNNNVGTITQQPTSTYSVDTSNVWVNYPLTGSPCPTGSTITLQPSTPQTQLLSLTSRSPFVATAIGSALDKLTLIAQQLQGQLNRAILAPAGTTAFSFPTSVPNNILGWDPGGSGNIVNFVPNTGAFLAKATTLDSQTATNDTKYMTPLQVATEVQYAGAVSIPFANLSGVAGSGTNSNITSLTGLTTPLTVAQGGTGSSVAANGAGGVVVPSGAVNAANGAIILNGSQQLPAVSAALVTNIVGAPISKTIGTIYQAGSDGIVEASAFSSTAASTMQGITDSSSTPSTVVQQSTTNAAQVLNVTFIVRKGNYYQVTMTATVQSPIMTFNPLGS